MELLYEDRTRTLRRGLFDVQNRVGVGRDEEDYHQAMVLWLKENNVPHASKSPHPLMLYGEVAHKLFPDLVVWDQITIELKAVPRNLVAAEFVQLFDYLKCRSGDLGLLVNMGLDRVHVNRIVYEQTPKRLEEDWSYWSGQIEGQDREIGSRVGRTLRDIYREHTTGYGDEVLRKLIVFALGCQGLTIIESPVVDAVYRGVVLRQSPLNCLLIENRIVLTWTALFDNNDFSMNRGRSYLRALNLQWGVAVNFGKTTAQFTGLRRTPSATCN